MSFLPGEPLHVGYAGRNLAGDQLPLHHRSRLAALTFVENLSWPVCVSADDFEVTAALEKLKGPTQ
jgi:hypothetical protein